MKMKDCSSATWKKLFEVPTRAKTTAGRIKALKNYTDAYNDISSEEIAETLNSEWCTVCDDGIVIWCECH